LAAAVIAGTKRFGDALDGLAADGIEDAPYAGESE